MRAIFRVLVQTKEHVLCLGTPAVTTFDNVRVTWVIGPADNLTEAVIEILGLPLTLTPDGAISYQWPELEEQAYRAAAYIANRVRIQTGLDALKPDSVLGKSADDLQPETEEERGEFQQRPKGRKQATLSPRALICGSLDPSDYGDGYLRSAAYALYTDALRAESPFVKFRLYYEVVEAFVPKKKTGEKFDRHVSKLARSVNQTLDPSDVEELRSIRNACVHAREEDHLSSEDLAALRTVTSRLQSLDALAIGLLRKPPYLTPAVVRAGRQGGK